MNTKPVMNPKTVKLALKIAAVTLAVIGALVVEWEAGAITDGAQFAGALVAAIAGNLNAEP